MKIVGWGGRRSGSEPRRQASAADSDEVPDGFDFCFQTLGQLELLFRTLQAGLFFSLPLGATEVIGAMGRVDVLDDSFGGLVSFLGFFDILLLRCSPFGIWSSSLSSVMLPGLQATSFALAWS